MTRACALALALLVLCTPVVFAQARLTGADLGGAVRDETGALIAGATVSATSLATAVARQGLTDGRGRFIIPGLAPGGYRVTIDKSGFANTTYDAIDLALGQSLELDVLLRVARLEAVVTVTAEAPMASARGTAVSEVVGQRQIENLPINGRNFISFAVITPGAIQDNTPSQGPVATSGLSFAGQRARSNNIMVDGLDNNDVAVGGVRAVFSQEAVSEFQVLTNSFSAEFGKASGGVVNILTKSGGNDLHGSIFTYFRDKSLNAKDHFERFDVFGDPIPEVKAPFRQYQYGATLGGPIRKQKTFFFASFERLDQTASNFVTIDRGAAATLTTLGFPVVPGPNRYAVKRTQVLGKVDHHWNTNSNLVVRANYADTHNENVEPFGGLIARSRGAAQRSKDYSVSASQSDVLSSRWFNEARIQFARQNLTIISLDPTCGGPCLGLDQGGPLVDITGVANVGRQRFIPVTRIPDRTQIVDTLSHFGASHQIKGGVDFNYIQSAHTVPGLFGGRFLFQNMAAMVAGTPANYVQGYGDPNAPYTYKDFSAFVQDEWRVSRKLTIAAGLRYQTQFWPNFQYDVSDVNGTRFRYALRQDRNDWAPRLSFAIDPRGNGRTAIHAAYGRYYDNQLAGYVAGTWLNNGTRIRTAVLGGSGAQAAWNAPGHRLTEAQVIALLGGPYPVGVNALDPKYQTPYAHQASAGFKQEFREGWSLSANVVYVAGKHQFGHLDYNPRIPSLGSPARRPNDVNGVAGTSTQVLQFTSYAQTWYRGLTVALQQRFHESGQWLFSYSLSKAEDNVTDAGGFVPQSMGSGRNPADHNGLPLGFDPNLDRGPSVWDHRHHLVISGVRRLPAGIQASAIITLATGRPFTPLAGVDLNGDGDAGNPPTDRARTNPADSATNVGRDSARLPGQMLVDVRVSRTFSGRRKGLKLEPMLEVFNLFNRANYTDVNNVFGPGSFPNNPAVDSKGRVTYGRFTQAQAPRQVQVAVKLSF